MTHRLSGACGLCLGAVLLFGCGDDGPVKTSGDPGAAAHKTSKAPPEKRTWSVGLASAPATKIYALVEDLCRQLPLHWKSRVTFEQQQRTLHVEAWFGKEQRGSHLMGGPGRPTEYRNVTDGKMCVLTLGSGVLIRRRPEEEPVLLAYELRSALVNGVPFYPFFMSVPHPASARMPVGDPYKAANIRYAKSSGEGANDVRVIEYDLLEKKRVRCAMKLWVAPGPRVIKRMGRGFGLKWTEIVDVCSTTDTPPDGTFTVGGG